MGAPLGISKLPVVVSIALAFALAGVSLWTATLYLDVQRLVNAGTVGFPSRDGPRRLVRECARTGGVSLGSRTPHPPDGREKSKWSAVMHLPGGSWWNRPSRFRV